MRTIKSAFIVVLVFASQAIAFAQAKDKGPVPGNRWGLIFDARNLLQLDGFEDGYQAGAGALFWADPKAAIRALLSVDHNNPSGDTLPTETILGIGVSGQWHPSRGRAVASPYLGPTAGVRILAVTDQATAIDIYFGAIFGVEAKLAGPVSFFGEYQLLASVDADGFSVTLGTARPGVSRALLGLIFYF
jgi:hypothetical protein